ncbi:AraC family transcriptional regulator [Rhizobium sp. TRM96647]|uniref:helix-turn-helix domain-containing protein n=1 Tax=unclassified Rhizobium TaxID=2613769 RepID=UPI0021E6FF1C|nr:MULTISPECIES: AraC family transcriptional regulator [unclassified Rhizobium]MCV3739418.1 AraC family transcriptional regulator [Rhizobium sp. TRM96647]MCV3761084.1 AraC family transcriptional regulator [Rhizobium sp. TRM96650]
MLTNSAASWNGIEFIAASEDIKKPTVWHLKPDTHSVVIHLAGSMSHFVSEVEGGDVAKKPPSPGEVWLVPAQTGYAAESQGDYVRYAEIRIPPEAAAHLLGQGAASLELKPRLAHSDEFIYQAAKLLERTVGTTDDLSHMLCQSVAVSVAYHILRSYTGGPGASRRDSPLRRSIKLLLSEYINDNLSRPILLDELAALAEMKTHSFLRSFKASFGTTPASYIIERRISEARRLLAFTSLDITAIAMATGFSSHSHLSTTFKRTTGVTPTDFRRDFRSS